MIVKFLKTACYDFQLFFSHIQLTDMDWWAIPKTFSATLATLEVHQVALYISGSIF